MPRIRTIKPEFFQDEKLAPLSPLDRLVFLGLISMADDAGRLLDNVKVIDAFIFACSDDTSRNSLDTLARLARIVRYTSESGQRLIQIRNWTDHQKVDHAARHVLPAPTDADLAQVAVAPPVADATAGDLREPRENVATSSRLDLGPRTNDLGPTTKQHARKKPRARSATADARRDTWLTPALTAWQKHNGPGSLSPGKAAKYLAPIHAGGIAPEEIGRRLDRYCAARKRGFCRIDDFAEHHAEWAASDAPLLDEHGWMTPELERETRPRDVA